MKSLFKLIPKVLFLFLSLFLFTGCFGGDALESVSFSSESYQVVEGESIKLTISTVPDQGEFASLSYSTSDSSIATVSSSGEVTGIAPGSATITVKSNKNSKVNDTCTVVVQELSDEFVLRVPSPTAKTMDVPQTGIESDLNLSISVSNDSISVVSYLANVSGFHTITTEFTVIFDWVKDEFGNRLFGDSLNYFDSVILKFEEGINYSFQIRKARTSGMCELNVYAPNEKVDITGYTNVSDVVRYYKQQLIYKYTAERNGLHRFSTDVTLYWKITDTYNNTVYNRQWPDGTTNSILVNLEENTEYTIVLNQYDMSGLNELKISIPNEKHSISNIRKVYDSMRFKSQQNVYEFTPEITGTYTFQVSYGVYWKVRDSYNNKVFDHNYPNGSLSSKSLKLTAGTTYTITLIQYESGSSNLGDYMIRISQ